MRQFFAWSKITAVLFYHKELLSFGQQVIGKAVYGPYAGHGRFEFFCDIPQSISWPAYVDHHGRYSPWIGALLKSRVFNKPEWCGLEDLGAYEHSTVKFYLFAVDLFCPDILEEYLLGHDLVSAELRSGSDNPERQ